MYEIILSKKAQKELLKIPKVYSKSIGEHIDLLANDPRPHGCKKLKGTDNEYRIRVGVYRVIYTIEDKILKVEVIRVASRGEAYE